MFNRKRDARIQELDNKLHNIYVYVKGGYAIDNDKEILYGNLIQNVNKLDRENQKLKAIVAELCDYVYRDK